MKNSFSLLELILTIIISSIITIYSFSFIKELFSTNRELQSIELYKLDLLSTKIFLKKNINDLNKLKYLNETLFFNDNILLEKVKLFEIKQKNKKYQIKINLADKITQRWEFLL